MSAQQGSLQGDAFADDASSAPLNASVMSATELRNLYDEPEDPIKPPRRLVAVAKLKQVARSAVEDRMAALRTQVEEVARNAYNRKQQTRTLKRLRAEGGGRRTKAGRSKSVAQSIPDEEVPMLIGSTEMGAYIRWAVRLQGQLGDATAEHQRTAALRETLRAENDALQDALDAHTMRLPLPINGPSAADDEREGKGVPLDAPTVAGAQPAEGRETEAEMGLLLEDLLATPPASPHTPQLEHIEASLMS